jgi:hypothetical protein
VVIVHDGMTKAAQPRRCRQARRGAAAAPQPPGTMRDDLVAVIEQLTASRVNAFMSANNIAPKTRPRSSC